jgi:hypothetical protein
MQKKKKRVPEFRVPVSDPNIRVFTGSPLYPTRIRSCSIRVLLVSEKRVFTLSVSDTRRVYPTRFHPE